MFFTEEGTRAPVRKAITFRLRHARSVRFRFWQGMRSSAPQLIAVATQARPARVACLLLCSDTGQRRLLRVRDTVGLSHGPASLYTLTLTRFLFLTYSNALSIQYCTPSLSLGAYVLHTQTYAWVDPCTRSVHMTARRTRHAVSGFDRRLQSRLPPSAMLSVKRVCLMWSTALAVLCV